MADGKWGIKEASLKRADMTFGGSASNNLRGLPNYGRHKPVDDRNGNAVMKCAFCNSEDLQSGFGGCGEGFGYRSFKCRSCGGTTDFVYRDDVRKYF